MNKKSYTAIILAAAMVAASPVAVFAQEAATQITSEVKAADDASDQSLSEQPWLPVLPAATQAQEFKMVSFAATEAVDQDGILSRTVADEENGLYVITYGDEEHPVLDADKNEITDEYVDALVKDLKRSETELQKVEKDQNKQEVQETQETLAALEVTESVVETFEIDYVVNGEETPLEAPRYVVLKIDGLLATDPVTILHQGETDGKAEWAPLEIVAQTDGLVCARFDSFSPTVVLSTKEVALTASAAATNDQATTAGNVTASQNTAQSNSQDGSNTNAAQNNANNTQNTTNNVQDNAGTVTTSEHTHTLTFVPAVAATSTQHGNIAYYKCDGCEKMTRTEQRRSQM